MVPAGPISRKLKAAGVVSLGQAKTWADLNGLSAETVVQIIRMNRKQITFETADKILVALESPEMWYTDSNLRAAYWPEERPHDWPSEEEYPPVEFALAVALFFDVEDD
jgi:plasmid maintenance system antidote protein VapI